MIDFGLLGKSRPVKKKLGELKYFHSINDVAAQRSHVWNSADRKALIVNPRRRRRKNRTPPTVVD